MVQKKLMSKKEPVIDCFEYINLYPLRFTEMKDGLVQKRKCYGIPTENIKAEYLEHCFSKFNKPEYIYIPEVVFFHHLHDYRTNGLLNLKSVEFYPFIENDNFYAMVILTDPPSMSMENVTSNKSSITRYIYQIPYESGLTYCDSFKSACAVCMERFLKTIPGGVGKITEIAE